MSMTPKEVEELRDMDDAEFRILMFLNLRELKGSVDTGAASAAEAATQAKVTNGRVTRLEMWQQRIIGAIAVLTGGVPIILWVAGQVLK